MHHRHICPGTVQAPVVQDPSTIGGDGDGPAHFVLELRLLKDLQAEALAPSIPNAEDRGFESEL